MIRYEIHIYVLCLYFKRSNVITDVKKTLCLWVTYFTNTQEPKWANMNFCEGLSAYKLYWTTSSVNSFSFIYFLDLLHHRVMRRRQRRKRNSTDRTLRLKKRRGGRKKSWKATRRKAKRTKRIMGRIGRRNRRRENTKHRPLLLAPVNPQTVTEKTEWFGTLRVNIYVLQSMKTCRHCANEAPHLFL